MPAETKYPHGTISANTMTGGEPSPSHIKIVGSRSVLRVQRRIMTPTKRGTAEAKAKIPHIEPTERRKDPTVPEFRMDSNINGRSGRRSSPSQRTMPGNR